MSIPVSFAVGLLRSEAYNCDLSKASIIAKNEL